MTAVKCPHCTLTCAGPQGLASHIRSMHPDVARAAALLDEQRADAPPAPPAAGLVWEDPPALGRTASMVPEVLAVAAQLRARPGQWARLRTFTGKTTASTLAGRLRKRPDSADLEFRGSRTASGSALFGRAKATDR